MSAHTTTVTLGYITTLTVPEGGNIELAEGMKISGAMTAAIAKVNQNPMLLENITLEYLLGDNQGSALESLRVMTGESYIFLTLDSPLFLFLGASI